MSFPSRFAYFVGCLALLDTPLPAEETLDQAEVRLPYGELRRLIEASAATPEPQPSLPASLLSSRLTLRLDDGAPVMEGAFETMRFDDAPSRIPLIGGEVSVVQSESAAMGLVVHDGFVCEIGAKSGRSTTTATFRISTTGREFTLKLPPCPGTVLDLSGLADDVALALTSDGQERVVSGGAKVPLPAEAGTWTIRFLDTRESAEALRPPEPSEWIWQHQALVTPAEGALQYRLLSHASAVNGSALEATLEMPVDARQVNAKGDDLQEARTTRDGDGRRFLHLAWKTRDVMEREVEISYLTTVRPLDELWTLRVPVGGDPAKLGVRYFLTSSPRQVYAADGLSERMAIAGLPSSLMPFASGASFHLLEGGVAVQVGVERLPVVETDEAQLTKANWSLGVEADGAMLVEGKLRVEFGGAEGIEFRIPEGLKLLSCRVNAMAVEPISRGDGRMEVPLVGQEKKTGADVTLSFTGKSEPFDPLEGMSAYQLPSTPLFIRELTWLIDLPNGYSAETSGNLTRTPRQPGHDASSVHLLKRLCRGEQPEVRIFYRSSNLLP